MYTCPAGHSQPGLQAASHITVLCNIRSVHVRRQVNAHVLNICPHTPINISKTNVVYITYCIDLLFQFHWKKILVYKNHSYQLYTKPEGTEGSSDVHKHQSNMLLEICQEDMLLYIQNTGINCWYNITYHTVQLYHHH